MAEATDTDYLSIGEVLALLLEEFPDVTISKIRFLESQGLIDPERTPSGYRKFYDADVELLRVILREQRENYLPLRVIKDRLETGAIDPSGEMPKPSGTPGTGIRRNGDASTVHGDPSGDARQGHDDLERESGDDATEVPDDRVAGHPAANGRATKVAAPGAASDSRSGAPVEHGRRATPTTNLDTGAPVAGHLVPAAAGDAAGSDEDHTPVTPRLLPGVVLDRQELRTMVGLTEAELAQLEDYGIVSGRGSGGGVIYGDDAVEIATVAVEFLRSGVEARHLRGWRTAAEREASLYEQLITPRLRQRNPEARADALDRLRRLDSLGARLRDAMMRSALRHHFEP